MLDQIGLACYLVDAGGRLRWTNAAGRAIVGDRVGDLYTAFVPRDFRLFAKRQFARKVVTGVPTEFDALLVDAEGRRLELRIHSAPVRAGGTILGVFGIAVPYGETTPVAHTADALHGGGLTPRQVEVLRLLARGLSTREIAAQLGIADETARNHIRGLLRGLGVHSRLEAVAVGRRRGLLDGTLDA
jgi:DNA-binding CsgD family transcriptional regulator